MKGRFLMSLNDHKEVRRIFRGLQIRLVGLKYSSMNGTAYGRATSAKNS
jgi:hypothetical protein